MDKQGLGWNVVITKAAGASNVSNVTFTVKDNEGNAIAEPVVLDVWVADDAAGTKIWSGTAMSSEVAGLANYGSVLGIITSKKAVRAVTNASGVFTLVITDTNKGAFYPCCSVPKQGGRIVVGTPLTSASYGA